MSDIVFKSHKDLSYFVNGDTVACVRVGLNECQYKNINGKAYYREFDNQGHHHQWAEVSPTYAFNLLEAKFRLLTPIEADRLFNQPIKVEVNLKEIQELKARLEALEGGAK